MPPDPTYAEMAVAQHTETVEVRNRWTNRVQFTATITCAPDASLSVKLGLAIKWGRLSDADLRGAVLSGAVLSDADLSDADLSDADLRGADLRDADLRGADLSYADLRGAVLRGADLRGAVLRGAVLRGADLSYADLRGAVLPDWLPRIANIHQTIYEAASQPDALDMSSWHCGTTHCRAGWAVTLAGDGGRVLEGVYGTAGAAALIYQASDPKLDRVPDFHCGNDAALDDMRAKADAEKVTA